MSVLDTHVIAFVGGIVFTLAFAAYGIPALKRL